VVGQLKDLFKAIPVMFRNPIIDVSFNKHVGGSQIGATVGNIQFI